MGSSPAAVRRQAEDLIASGDLDPAATLLAALRDRQAKQEHPDQADFARTLKLMATLAFQQKKLSDAQAFASESLERYREAVGPFSLGTAALLGDLASAADNAGYFGAAEKLMREATDLQRRLAGENDPRFANGLQKLGGFLLRLGSYREAEQVFRNAVQIRTASLPLNDGDRIESIESLGESLRYQARYADAEPFYLEALKLLSSLESRDRPLATLLNNLALCYKSWGRYREARRYYLEALSILRAAPEPGSSDLGIALLNLASLFQDMADYATAEHFYVESAELVEKAVGRNHPDFALVANNLGDLYRVQRRFTESERLLGMAVRIRREFLCGHPSLATSLQNLALVNMLTGRLQSARTLCEEAIGILELSEAGGQTLARPYATMSQIDFLRGDSEAAARYIEKASQIMQAQLGPSHPDFANVLSTSAFLAAARGQAKEALAIARRVSDIDDSTLVMISSFASDERRLAYLAQLSTHLSQTLALVWNSFRDDPEAVQFAFAQVLTRKNLAAEALALRRDAAVNDPAMRSKLDRLSQLAGQLSNLIVAGPRASDWTTYANEIGALQGEKDALEVELAGQVPELDLQRRLRGANAAEIAPLLPEESVLLEFIRFEPVEFEHNRLLPEQYFAFVLHAGRPDSLRLIALGDADELDGLVRKLREGITESGAKLLSRFRRPTLGRAGRELSQLLLGPLLPLLDGARRVLIAPDGALHLLPFEVLPWKDNALLRDRWVVAYVPSGRDVMRFKSGVPAGSPSVVAAAADFNAGTKPPTTIKPETNPGANDAAVATAAGVPYFPPLAGTRKEGREVSAALGVKAWLGADVLESRLKQLHSPQILHVATHGFFFPRNQWTTMPNAPLDGSRRNIAEYLQARNIIENPLVRSGLALAGANSRSLGLEPLTGAEDGILTGLDVTGINLTGTHLAVLSACVTGLGDLHPSEGVMGLRRSFSITGAGALIVSLWNVPDRATSQLMRNFYRLVARGVAPVEALRGAQTQVSRWHRNPYFWGAFVCQGNGWEPIALSKPI